MNLPLFFAVAVCLAGSAYIIDMIRRRDESLTGRLWAVAFLLSMQSGFVRLLVDTEAGAQTPALFAMGSNVMATGCFWLGALASRGHLRLWHGLVLLVVAAGAGLYPLAPVVGGATRWQPLLAMLAATATLSFLAAREILARPRTVAGARTLAGLFLVRGVYMGAATVSTLVPVLSDTAHRVVFSVATSTMVSLVTVAGVAVTLVVGSALERTRMAPGDGVARAADAARMIADARGSLAVISVRIDGLKLVATAFGASEAVALREVWHDTVRRRVPHSAAVGEDGTGGLFVLLAPPDARRVDSIAREVRRTLNDEVARAGASVVPIVGVGTAEGQKGQDVLARARAAAGADARAARGNQADVSR